MNKEQIKEKMISLNEKLKVLKEKASDAIDTAKIKGMYAKDKIDELAVEAKGNANAARENLKILSEKVKGKASSELLKAQMNLDAARKDLEARKEAHDKASLEAYIDEVSDYAVACADLSVLASEEARLAAIEAIRAEQEYNEKYGNEE